MLTINGASLGHFKNEAYFRSKQLQSFFFRKTSNWLGKNKQLVYWHFIWQFNSHYLKTIENLKLVFREKKSSEQLTSNVIRCNAK